MTSQFLENQKPLPALFIGHGSPMNAIEDNEFSQAWEALGKTLPRPEAILCISAHWETHGTQATAMDTPRTIHDFYGFPKELFAKTYPAPGSPALAAMLQETLAGTTVKADQDWGLDHGAWSVLCRLYPQADVPVVQLSLDRALSPEAHYALGQALRPLRRRGVLVVGSGNMVHNLGRMVWQEGAFDWALDFDRTLERLILAGDHAPIIHYEDLGTPARLSIPTNEHFLPLLYILALQEPNEQVEFFAQKVTYGAISMRGVKIFS